MTPRSASTEQVPSLGHEGHVGVVVDATILRHVTHCPSGAGERIQDVDDCFERHLRVRVLERIPLEGRAGFYGRKKLDCPTSKPFSWHPADCRVPRPSGGRVLAKCVRDDLAGDFLWFEFGTTSYDRSP